MKEWAKQKQSGKRKAVGRPATSLGRPTTSQEGQPTSCPGSPRAQGWWLPDYLTWPSGHVTSQIFWSACKETYFRSNPTVRSSIQWDEAPEGRHPRSAQGLVKSAIQDNQHATNPEMTHGYLATLLAHFTRATTDVTTNRLGEWFSTDGCTKVFNLMAARPWVWPPDHVPWPSGHRPTPITDFANLQVPPSAFKL